MLQCYHVTAKLVVQEMRGNMGWQQVEQNAFVAVLQRIHLALLLIRLKEIHFFLTKSQKIREKLQ